MSKWKNPIVNLGEVYAHSKTTVYFYLAELTEIKGLSSSCGCTTPEFEQNKGRLKVIYKAGKLPLHLESQTIKTHVKVTYEDKTVELLYINATKIKG